jgi:signal transduction histidine kinase/CheY-like chemotaxis protein
VEASTSILLLDSNAESAEKIQESLHTNGHAFRVSHATDLLQGLNMLKASLPDAVLLDGDLIEDVEFPSVKSYLSDHRIPSILISAVNGQEVKNRAHKAGATEYLVKQKISPQYLQNTIHSAIRLIETENKLSRVFEEYTGRIESFMLMLDTLKEGVVIINKTGEVCYTNELGNAMLSNDSLHIEISNFLNYRELTAEETVTVQNDLLEEIHIRTNNFFWNGEPCNILVIEKKQAIQKTEVIREEVTPVQSSSPLAEPFEALLNSVQLIAEHEANGRADEAAQCAELAGQTVLQSEKILGDVKSFISLAHYQPAFARLSMQNLVGDVLKAMGPEIEEAGIEVSVSDLPEAIGDKELILKLIKHLINNALKFRNTGRKAVIDIGHDKSDGQFIFCIRDNGIGISKKHHEEIFNLFFKLNDAAQYPGNGMGLAICKKIVGLHNGRIWVESLPGHGSNFYFKLNAKL